MHSPHVPNASRVAKVRRARVWCGRVGWVDIGEFIILRYLRLWIDDVSQYRWIADKFDALFARIQHIYVICPHPAYRYRVIFASFSGPRPYIIKLACWFCEAPIFCFLNRQFPCFIIFIRHWLLHDG